VPTNKAYTKLLSGRLDGATLTRLVKDLKTQPASTIRDTLRRMPQSNSRQILANMLPRNFADLGHATTSPFTGRLDAEVGWAAALAARHADAIVAFLEGRSQIECRLLKGDYSRSLEDLLSLEKRIGVSLWSLRRRLALAERIGGLKGNRSSLREAAEASTSGILDIFAEYFSRAAETAGSLASYTADVDQMIHKATDQGKFKAVGEYLRFRLIPHAFHDYSELAHILLKDGAFSIIDKYETFVTVLQLIVSSGATLPPNVQRSINFAFEAVKDQRLGLVLRALAPSLALNQTDASEQLVSLADMYTKGDYGSASVVATSLLEKHPDCLDFYLIALKSIIYAGQPFVAPLPPECPAGKLARDIYDVLQKSDRTPEALDSIGRTALLLPGSPLAAQLISFALANTRRPKAHFSTAAFASLNAHAPSAAFSRIYAKSSDALTFLSSLGRVNPGSPSIALFAEALNHGTFALDTTDERRQRYAGLAKLEAGDPDSAISELLPLTASLQPTPVREEALRAVTVAYLQRRQYTACAELLAEAYADRPQLLSTIDVTPIAAGYGDADAAERGRLAWPIICQLRLREAPSADNKRILVAALDEFLVAQKARRPSELLANPSRFSRKQLVYFLRNVCVLDVMDSLVGFATVDELHEERILLCQQLMEVLDTEHGAAYASEIRRLTQDAEVKKAIRHVDESKVNIDTAGIARSLDPSFKERFARFVAFSQLMPALRDRLEVKGVKDAADEDLIVVTVDQVAHFSELFTDIKARFISSNEYGLDTYLSVRIRHGTLSGQLRSLFEREDLITRKGPGEVYEQNAAWHGRLFARLGPAVTAAVDTRLREFSRDVDSIIDEVKTQWIQVKGLSSPGAFGLFDFDYSEEEILDLYSRLADVTDYEEFLDTVFAELWGRTERNLAVVVEKLRGELAERFTAVLDGMAADLYRLHDDIKHSAFSAAVTRARTSILHELDIVAGWFRRSSHAEFPEFGLRLLAETSVAIVRNCYRARPLVATISGRDEVQFDGKHFAPLADVMFILLENVIRHGGSLTPSAEVELGASGARVQILVRNPLPAGQDLDEVRRKVAHLPELSNAALSGDVRREGGTGFRKLHRVLRVDLAREKDYAIETRVLDSPPVFEVAVTFSAQGLGR